jgi:hypothetical protein
MMSIKGHSNRWGSWHIGEDMRVPEGPVITFQVDGHELEWLIGAIEDKLSKEGRDFIYPTLRLTPVL